MALDSFTDIELRVKGLVATLGGDLWADMLASWRPPQTIPSEQEVLDMTYRDTKALAGYIPDIRRVAGKTDFAGISVPEKNALLGLYGYLNMAARLLMQISVIPRYHDHADLIETLAGYRFTLNELKGCLSR